VLTGFGFDVPAEIAKATAANRIPRSRVAYWLCERYANFTNRAIVPARRRVYRSREIRSRVIGSDHWRTIQRIARESAAGESLNPYLSTRLEELDHDDRLRNEWRIHRMHLGWFSDRNRPQFVQRTGPVLFVLVEESDVYFLDVKSHGHWADEDLVETLHSNWPQLLIKYRVRGILPGSRRISQPERKTARKAGLYMFTTTMDGTVYMPFGGGYSTSGHGIESAEQSAQLHQRAARAARPVVARLVNRLARSDNAPRPIVSPVTIPFTVGQRKWTTRPFPNRQARENPIDPIGIPSARRRLGGSQ
jgi:hypothetical protein